MVELSDERASVLIDESFLFKSVDANDLEALKTAAFWKTFEAGMTIIEEGDQGGDLLIIDKGEVEVSTTMSKDNVTLATLTAGAVVGEVAVATGAPRTSTVTAVGDVTVIIFPSDAIKRITNAYPKVKALLERMVEGRARHTISCIPDPIE